MWVNEAQRGDAVSNTYTRSLISGRGGLGVGVGLRDGVRADIKSGNAGECI